MDPANEIDSQCDLLVREGRVEAVGRGLEPSMPVREIDCRGLVVAPGLVDAHVHFGEPGQVARETIGSGSEAAARGGFTTVVCMPDTRPVIDTAGTVALIRDRVAEGSRIRIEIAGAITRGLAGEELAPAGSLSRAGVVAISDSGHGTQNSEVMRRALEYARMFGLPVLGHCCDRDLAKEGLMHEGYWNLVLGLPAWPSSAEEIMVGRNIQLAELTGTHVHCLNISTEGSVRLLREARERGAPVSGGTCPHYLILTDAALAGSRAYGQEDGRRWREACGDLPEWFSYDTRFKTSPPLRSAADAEAVAEGLGDGTLEMIYSDHSPHSDYEKEVEFDAAPFGVTGLETTLSLGLMALYHPGRLSLSGLVAALSCAPSRMLGLDRGHLAAGQPADVVVFDPDRERIFDRTLSKGKNSPFLGWNLKGVCLMTLVEGEVVWQDPSLA